MGLRSTVNRTTGYTPNMMMFGRETTLPMNIIMRTADVNLETVSPPQYLQNIVEILYETHAEAREKLMQVQIGQKRDYDLKRHEHQYEKGDFVYILESATKLGQSKKLNPVYSGPFLIMERINPVLHRMQFRRKDKVIHHDRLKLCRDAQIPMWLRRKRHELLDLDVTIAYDEEEQALDEVDRPGVPGRRKVIPDVPVQQLIGTIDDLGASGGELRKSIVNKRKSQENLDRDEDFEQDEGSIPLTSTQEVVRTRQGRVCRRPAHLQGFVD
jgi:hypothetical protein